LLKAFGSELNQAWAALIENSLDAMGDSGTLTLSTKLQGKTILVEIADTGQGFLQSVRIVYSSLSLLRNRLARG
jgi:signal transduction histidine kinase